MEAVPDRLDGLPASWLRANCQCGACVDPGSGQRLVAITDPARDHQVEFPDGWLEAALAPGDDDDRTEDAKRLWQAADFAAGPPAGSWAEFQADHEHRAWGLSSLLATGFLLLTGTPVVDGTVLEITRSLGFVRETNYGKVFNVKVVPDPSNLAYSARAIGPHTDNPYRDPVPTVQLLHCLVSAAQGGDSGLVDGFAAASLLRAQNPASFEVLTRTPVTFAYRDATADLRATLPMIGLSARGRIRQVRFNNRSLQPLRPDPGEARGAFAARAEAFYLAYREFAGILTRPGLQLTLRLEPGDCLIFDNTRVMHARTAFAADGFASVADRHLQGCYADLDGVASALAVLRRAAGNGDQPR